jgi:hypothetical protein
VGAFLIKALMYVAVPAIGKIGGAAVHGLPEPLIMPAPPDGLKPLVKKAQPLPPGRVTNPYGTIGVYLTEFPEPPASPPAGLSSGQWRQLQGNIILPGLASGLMKNLRCQLPVVKERLLKIQVIGHIEIAHLNSLHPIRRRHPKDFRQLRGIGFHHHVPE